MRLDDHAVCVDRPDPLQRPRVHDPASAPRVVGQRGRRRRVRVVDAKTRQGAQPGDAVVMQPAPVLEVAQRGHGRDVERTVRPGEPVAELHEALLDTTSPIPGADPTEPHSASCTWAQDARAACRSPVGRASGSRRSPWTRGPGGPGSIAARRQRWSRRCRWGRRASTRAERAGPRHSGLGSQSRRGRPPTGCGTSAAASVAVRSTIRAAAASPCRRCRWPAPRAWSGTPSGR